MTYDIWHMIVSWLFQDCLMTSDDYGSQNAPHSGLVAVLWAEQKPQAPNLQMKLLSSSQAAFQFLWIVGEWCQRMSKEISGLVRSLFKQCLLENLWKPWLIFLNHAVKGVPVFWFLCISSFWPRPAILSCSRCQDMDPPCLPSHSRNCTLPRKNIFQG